MIPDYQTLMLPLLKLVSDGQEHKYRDIIENLATEFEVTDEERKELLASGNQAIFDNRVGWAKTYLKKAGLLDSPKRATFVITDIDGKLINSIKELNSSTVSINLSGNAKGVYVLYLLNNQDKSITTHKIILQ